MSTHIRPVSGSFAPSPLQMASNDVISNSPLKHSNDATTSSYHAEGAYTISNEEEYSST
jgi:hypothetical protein